MINWNIVFSVALGVAIGFISWKIICWLLWKMYAVSGKAYPWCHVFIWWLFNQHKANDLFFGGKKTASCTTLMDYAKGGGTMEIKKAIEVLNTELQHTKQHFQYEDKAKEYYEEMKNIIDATEMAISALYKQEPMEPYIHEIKYPHMPDITVVQCPTCNRRLRTKRTTANGDQYCPDCGQRLDWSEWKENDE